MKQRFWRPTMLSLLLIVAACAPQNPDDQQLPTLAQLPATTGEALATPQDPESQITEEGIVEATTTLVPTAPPAATPDPYVEQLTAAYQALEGIESLRLVYAAQEDGQQWTISNEIVVSAGYNTPEMADAILQATYQALGEDRVKFFSTILDDSSIVTDYAWDTLNRAWNITPLSQ